MQIHPVDLVIFFLYLLFMMGIGFYFLNKNKTREDYFVGGRKMTAGHVGLSVVATDVGGGFSIGLGGLGFTLGISGSWMLFTGLLGAWLSAVILIPRIYPLAVKYKFLTFPDAIRFFYNNRVAWIAGLISLIGYLGFTSSQILAGAKLASATIPEITLTDAVLLMGIIVVVYTAIGGIQAVIYTDTIQWIILIAGLFLIGVPYGFYKVGGWENIKNTLGDEFFSLSNISFSQIFNWIITIIPIWFVGMTLYQRIYSCKDEKTALKAWRIAGWFEWPVMAFLGVILGILARVAFENGMFEQAGYSSSNSMDAELGLPLFLSHALPAGLLGLMMSAYFSAIMSTADSCLMAASGILSSDILKAGKKNENSGIRFSQWITLLIGAFAILLATVMTNVLDLMLYSYSFMVSGLFIPVLGMLFMDKPTPAAAIFAMITGGAVTLILILSEIILPFGLNENLFGIISSGLVFITIEWYYKRKIVWRS